MYIGRDDERTFAHDDLRMDEEEFVYQCDWPMCGGILRFKICHLTATDAYYA